MDFKRMSGAGNTFWLTKLVNDAPVNKSELSALAARICKKTGEFQPTDGVVFVVDSNAQDFKWEFYNSDGSSAEMCGNAARCVTRFAYDLGIAKASMSFETLAGVIYAQVLQDKQVQVSMTPIHLIKENLDIKNEFPSAFEGGTPGDSKFVWQCDWIDSGVPHCVIHCSNTNWEFFREQAIFLRHKNFFAPKGANITFLFSHQEGKIDSVSFERGVEDFTAACGTGAVAAAFSHKLKFPQANDIEVQVPGGLLHVSFAHENPILTGPAVYTHDQNPRKADLVIDLG